jgi:hypothetical protein
MAHAVMASRRQLAWLALFLVSMQVRPLILTRIQRLRAMLMSVLQLQQILLVLVLHVP